MRGRRAGWMAVLMLLALGCTLLEPIGGTPTVQPATPPPTATLPPTEEALPSPVATAAPTLTPPVVTATPSPAPPPPPPTTPPQPTAPPPTAAPTTPPAGPVSVWETTITLNSYGWEEALRPSTPDQPFYPYPALDFGAVQPPAPREFQAVVLENEFVRLTILPPLGGRILRWEDKRSGIRLTYANPVLKPTHWGYRGWWLATGGLEWAFPVEEHGLDEYRPWAYELLGGEGWRGVHLWDTDDRTGLRLDIYLALRAGESAFTVRPRITNPTGSAQPLQFWINAMLTLSGGNAPSPSLTFWVPTEGMIVHSTGDGSLPGPRSVIAWPVWNGRDFSHYGEWHHYLGLFATEARGAMGAYDTGSDEGMVRSYPPDGPQGVKIFALGDLPSDLYTDDGSRYVEIWGGYNRTFFPEDTISLPAGAALTWEERWYPLTGIHGLRWADGLVALNTAHEGGGLTLYAEASAPVARTFLLRRGEERVQRWDASLTPAAPWSATYAGDPNGLTLQVWEGDHLLTEIVP